MVCPTDTLEQGRDRTGRADLADQLDGTHVDAELERSSSDEGAQIAGSESCLDPPASLGRQAPVVGGHDELGVIEAIVRATEAFGEEMGNPFGKPTGVDEDQRRTVLEHVAGDGIEDLVHLPVAGHRLELVEGKLKFEVEGAVAHRIDDHRLGSTRSGPAEQARHRREGALGGREADSLERATRLLDEPIEPLQAHREVASALVSSQCVDLIDDHRPDAREHLAT